MSLLPSYDIYISFPLLKAFKIISVIGWLERIVISYVYCSMVMLEITGDLSQLKYFSLYPFLSCRLCVISFLFTHYQAKKEDYYTWLYNGTGGAGVSPKMIGRQSEVNS